jgi:anti-sigma regulatory factor (Ser/Thr protein kinase)
MGTNVTRPSQKETMDFLAAVVGEEVRAIDKDFGNGYVRLATSEAARRQAKHDIRQVEDIVIELLRNARDAGARTIYIATTTEGSKRTLVVLDDGEGIDPDMWDRIFEPRVTSKLETIHIDEWGVHGRGMALYSIRENAVSAQIKTSERGQGTALYVEIDHEDLSQRADQSSWPTISTVDGELQIRGPHNIIRTVVEFAVTHPEVTVYLGSPAEIVATIRDCSAEYAGRLSLTETESQDGRNQQSNHEWIGSPIALTDDAVDLAEAAQRCGFQISERTAYRIISSQIIPVEHVRFRYDDESVELKPEYDISFEALEKDARGLRIAQDDLDAFRLEAEKAFDSLAEKYYLDLDGMADVSIKGNTVRVSFRFAKQ